MRRLFIFIVLIISVLHLSAQSDKQLIRKGNKDFNKSDFQQAEKNYSKALETNPSNNNAAFNLGTSRYAQENFEEAIKDFDRAASMSLNADKEAESYYNLGNSLMSMEKYQESIEAYKQVLRSQPDNENARYNLAYAQWKLNEQQNQQQDQQEQQQDQQEEQNDKQEENQENQQQDQQQQDQENQDQNQQQDQQQANNEQQQQGSQPQPQQLTKEDAERMLQALQNNEKKTLDKVNEQKVKSAARISKEKDW